MCQLIDGLVYDVLQCCQRDLTTLRCIRGNSMDFHLKHIFVFEIFVNSIFVLFQFSLIHIRKRKRKSKKNKNALALFVLIIVSIVDEPHNLQKIAFWSILLSLL